MGKVRPKTISKRGPTKLSSKRRFIASRSEVNGSKGSRQIIDIVFLLRLYRHVQTFHQRIAYLAVRFESDPHLDHPNGLAQPSTVKHSKLVSRPDHKPGGKSHKKPHKGTPPVILGSL